MMKTTWGVLDPPVGNTRLSVVRLVASLLQSNTHSINIELINLNTLGVVLVSASLITSLMSYEFMWQKEYPEHKVVSGGQFLLRALDLWNTNTMKFSVKLMRTHTHRQLIWNSFLLLFAAIGTTVICHYLNFPFSYSCDKLTFLYKKYFNSLHIQH